MNIIHDAVSSREYQENWRECVDLLNAAESKLNEMANKESLIDVIHDDIEDYIGIELPYSVVESVIFLRDFWLEHKNSVAQSNADKVEIDKLKAKAVMDFAGDFINAYASGFVDTPAISIGTIYEVARNHVKDNFSLDTKSLTDEYSEEFERDVRFGIKYFIKKSTI